MTTELTRIKRGLVALLFVGSSAIAAPVSGDELEAQDVGESAMDAVAKKNAAHDAHMKWWREARFGCFVHWGVSSQLKNMWRGKEGPGYAEHIQRVQKISMADYKAEAIDKFNPTQFNADEWIDLIERAGMRYFVFTGKHHDGFAMYDSKVSDYNVVKATPWKTDPARLLKDACDRKGIKFGFYYSHAFDWGEEFAPGNDWEWQNPGGDKGLLGGRNWWEGNQDKLNSVVDNYVNTKAIPQILELIHQYHPALLWFDTPHKLPVSENERILAIIRKEAPDIVVNGRLVRGEGDYLNTGDRAVEFAKIDADWEAIPTTNESYGWNPYDHSHKTPEFLIRVLCKAVSRGGNILLNVGPTNTGEIDPVDVAILEGIGKWMDVNSEAIHGCNASPLPPQSWGVITSREKTLYLHVFDWSQGVLEVGGLISNPTKAILLTAKGDVPLKWKRITKQDIVVALPPNPSDNSEATSVVRLEFANVPQGGGDRLLGTRCRNQLLAFDANFHRGDESGMKEAGFEFRDGKQNNYALGKWKHTSQWISWTVRLNEPTSFDVSFRYGIGMGGQYELRIGDQRFTKTAPMHKTSRNIPRIATPRTDKLGSVSLPAGTHTIELRVTEGNKSRDEIFRPLELFMTPTGK